MPSGLQAGSLVRAMLDVREGRKTGVLTVVAEEVTTEVLFDGGEPVDATEQGTPGEPLGRLLVRTRVLTPEQHAKVIDAMASSLKGRRSRSSARSRPASGSCRKRTSLVRSAIRCAGESSARCKRDRAQWTFTEDSERIGKAARHESFARSDRARCGALVSNRAAAARTR
jgi:hypothetical protein